MRRFLRVQLWLPGLLLLSAVSALAQGYGPSTDVPEIPRLVQHLLAIILGAMCGAFYSHKLRKVRKWLILGSLGLLAFAGIILNELIANIILFFAAAVVAWFALRENISRELLKKPAKPTTFGSAEWANLAHLQENYLIGEEGFLLGFYEDQGQRYPLQYTSDRHLLTVAPTRSGKGVSSIIPNLLTYEGSAIVIDPKGENARITAFRRGPGKKSLNIPGMGQAVHIVDPWGITRFRVSCFNPLDWLKPEDEDINENAMILADSIVTPRQGTLEPFWDEEAKALLMGLLLYVALDEREEGNRNLGRIRDIISMGEDAFKDIMLQMVENPNPIVCSTAERTISKEVKLRSNVLASLQAHTHFLDSPSIRASLKASDFRFEDLKTSRMTVYLVLPADRLDTFGRWLRLLVQQAITVNARKIEVTPRKPILFLLDEMAALGRLTMVEQAFGLMAGFGMQLWGIVQDLSQLEGIYGIGWETFIGNSGVLQYFGSRDHKTAEYFSKLCGVTTIKKFSLSKAIADVFNRSWLSGMEPDSFLSTRDANKSTSYTESTTEDLVQRHLAFSDELMVLRDNKQLLMIENFNSISAKKIIWHDDDKLKALGVNLKKPQLSPPSRVLPKRVESPPFSPLLTIGKKTSGSADA